MHRQQRETHPHHHHHGYMIDPMYCITCTNMKTRALLEVFTIIVLSDGNVHLSDTIPADDALRQKWRTILLTERYCSPFK